MVACTAEAERAALCRSEHMRPSRGLKRPPRLALFSPAGRRRCAIAHLLPVAHIGVIFILVRICLTSKVSYACAWRGACESTIRDKHTHWLHCLVRLILHFHFMPLSAIHIDAQPPRFRRTNTPANTNTAERNFGEGSINLPIQREKNSSQKGIMQAIACSLKSAPNPKANATPPGAIVRRLNKSMTIHGHALGLSRSVMLWLGFISA